MKNRQKFFQRTTSILCFSSLIFVTGACQYFQRNQVVTSPNYYQTKWDHAILALREQNVEEAEADFKEVYKAGINEEPELATRALFELAQINERRGQWTLALAQFKECEAKKNYLPGFKAELELPSRLAGLYATLGELKISESYARKVEANLQVYMMQVSMTQQKAWWAETFYRMGSLPVNYINADNWQAFAKRFHSTSQYLIRSMELSDPIWSARSLELAQNFFKKSFELISVSSNESEENSVLLGTVIRDRISLLQEIFRKLELYKPIRLEESHTVWLFYQSVEDYQNQVKSTLYNVKDAAPVSRESQKRNAIQREGKLISPPGSPSIDKNSNDPNL